MPANMGFMVAQHIKQFRLPETFPEVVTQASPCQEGYRTIKKGQHAQALRHRHT
ncbi:hypothetical protein GGE35_002790 [Rhizobium cellulosilyticum]|uniref:Uncharacterized protein n=1 Tax=Aliirhizobium cellulosilyticum TaxID=393664 RepID=A0A7W6WQS1_9HYPH|nr:hypothetical protein [Rhizobium cellulosilyticum]MBB4412337.1 hypothetical protein [Rhizobium cellulosilyticum]MBB4446968.1 hypothetical protein [Rhizobium cellulosilyticum]